MKRSRSAVLKEDEGERIGTLPSCIPDSIRKQLDDILTRDSSIAARLDRDRILASLYEGCDYSKETARKYYSRQHVELLDIVYRESSKYVDLMHKTVQEYITDSVVVSPADLMIPARIPNEYNIESRRRVQNILSSLYTIAERDDQKKDCYVSPYEIGMQLSTFDADHDSNSRLYSTEYMGQIPVFIKDRRDSHVLLHEYMVGILVNSLRADIPNFMYTYGLSDSVRIITVGDRQYFYPTNSRTYKLYTELIPYTVTVYDMSRMMSCKVHHSGRTVEYKGMGLIRLILLQVLCAIAYAYSKIGFIHRDMNMRNILLVRLPKVQAVPIMIPVSAESGVQFKRRWILTDLLVMLVDYGLSTVDSDTLNSSIYPYDRLVSPLSIYLMYEGLSAFENDIVILLKSMYSKVSKIYKQHCPDDLLEIGKDFIRILYRLYTGSTLPDSTINSSVCTDYFSREFRYYSTHPLVQYDPYGAVVNFCRRYSKYYVSDDCMDYTDILKRSADREYQLSTIADSRTYYWYLKYSDHFSNMGLDLDSIAADQWYCEQLPTILKDNSHRSNADVVAALIQNSTDPSTAVLLILSVYRYVLHYKNTALNVLPFRYEQPIDILQSLIEYIDQDTTSTYQVTVLNHIIRLGKLRASRFKHTTVLYDSI